MDDVFWVAKIFKYLFGVLEIPDRFLGCEQ